MSQVRIGVSGWSYPHWRRDVFYPKSLVQRRELEFVSTKVNSAEINGSFYSLQRPSSYQAWHDQTPANFVFAVKGSRFISHMKKLKGVETPLANFFASGVLALGEKLGPILWQLPPNLKFDAQRLAAFFDLLPRDTSDAAKLAGQHDYRLDGRALTRTDKRRTIRYAVEIRHETYQTPDFVRLLRRHKIALCIADTAGKFPFFEDVTADFVYVRLHGAERLYASGYTDPQLDGWAQRIAHWQQGSQFPAAKLAAPQNPPPKRRARDVYVYFDNDAEGHAPHNAIRLAARLQDG